MTTCVFSCGALAATDAPVVPHVVVRTVDNHRDIPGDLLSFTLEDGLDIAVSGHEPRRIATEDVVGIRLVGRAREQRREREALIRLTNGDVLVGTIAHFADERLSLLSRGAGEISVDLERIRRIEMPRSHEAAHAQSAAWVDHDAAQETDRLLLTNGDVLEGFILALQNDGFLMEIRTNQVNVPARLVVVAELASPNRPPPSSPYAQLTLIDGSHLTTTSLRWTPLAASIGLPNGEPHDLAPQAITEVEIAGGRWFWLEQLDPITVEHTPTLDLPWEMQRGRSVTGDRLQTGGVEFDHGLGVHSRARLVYRLAGEHRAFVTSFGIQDESGPLADVDVTIKVDDAVRYRQDSVVQGRLHGPHRIDLGDADRLELIVDFGKNAGIQDRFNWLDAALAK